MSERRHTPGPWYVRRDPSELQVVCWDETETPGEDPPWIVCGVAGDCGDGDEEANAHLIAAAPDLLSALAEVRHGLQMLFDAGTAPDAEWLDAEIKKMDATLSRARAEPKETS